MRHLLIVGLFTFACLGWSAEAPPATTPPTTTPPATNPTTPEVTTQPGTLTVGSNRFYAYSLKQTVGWDSAGDKLTYTSTLTWKFLLTVAEVAPTRAVLNASILRVQATHEGPGSRRMVDSGAKDGDDGGEDALLGHLLALNGAVLNVVIDPTTGQVSEVQGGEAIIARINKRVPSAIPGDPPPLDAAARAAFSSEALTRIWNQLLVQPSATPARVPLGPPLQGEIERTWQGSDFTLRLPAGVERLKATLVVDPTPVEVVLSALTGSGSTSVVGGLPGAAKGDLAFTLTFTALTQPVQQRHTLAWELVPLQPSR